VRIAAQLLEAGNLGVFRAKIHEETAHCDVVVAFGCRTERGGEGLDGVGEGQGQRMLERRTAPTLLHGAILGWGWMLSAAARAYWR
jgi:hypothetical protein